ncbi:MAG: hypothetical protein JWQ47_129 [Glaciihabitans sp.]|nr:hypothetical protein [Glaciihabitans sp.]
MTDLIIGAYAASPTMHRWDPAVEADYVRRVMEIDGVTGLELPWTGSLHPHDPEWLLSTLEPSWKLVLTSIPGTVARLDVDPHAGLASTDAEGRAAAIGDARLMRDAVETLNTRAVSSPGNPAVLAVELHSAPRVPSGSDARRLADSLEEVSSWDWGGTSLLIEHSDAFVAGQDPSKGFLTLRDEIEAVDAVRFRGRGHGGGIGIALNWGRSAIELRDPDRVTEHVDAAADSGLLAALVFSGAAATANRYGAPWADVHPPFGPSIDRVAGPGAGTDAVTESTSLLTAERAADALAHAGRLDWVGIKMGWKPPEPADEGDPLPMLTHAAAVVSGLLR